MPTKKVAAPKTVTRTATKKVKTVAPKKLVYATDAESFWTHDGQILNSLAVLRDALPGMSKAVFAYHVTKDKNDFAEWVEQVLRDAACAADLRKAKTPASARTVIVRHLKLYRA